MLKVYVAIPRSYQVADILGGIQVTEKRGSLLKLERNLSYLPSHIQCKVCKDIYDWSNDCNKIITLHLHYITLHYITSLSEAPDPPHKGEPPRTVDHVAWGNRSKTISQRLCINFCCICWEVRRRVIDSTCFMAYSFWAPTLSFTGDSWQERSIIIFADTVRLWELVPNP